MTFSELLPILRFIKSLAIRTIAISLVINSAACSQESAIEIFDQCISENIDLQAHEIAQFTITSEKLDIHIPTNASEEHVRTAQLLQNKLEKIFSHKPQLIKDGIQKGIWLGTSAQFPQCTSEQTDDTYLESVSLYTHRDGVNLVASGESAIEPTMWHFLRELGYRQYFPGLLWEHIPQYETKSIFYNQKFSPSVHSRHVWNDWGFESPSIEKEYSDWASKNSLHIKGKFALGHNYQNIYRDSAEKFNHNPSWSNTATYANDVKLCVSQPDLVQHVEKWSLSNIQQRNSVNSISLEPSDGDGWDIGCKTDAAIGNGSPSDRAFFLSNQVASFLADELADTTYVTTLAYHKHNRPPSFALHDSVLVFLANGYFTGLNRESLFDQWKRKDVSALGMYEYFCQESTYHHQPGQSNISKDEFLVDAYEDWVQDKVIAISAQSCDAFGPQGIQLYLAAQLMWRSPPPGDGSISDFAKSIIEEEKNLFYDNMFGPAHQSIETFYQMHRPREKFTFKKLKISDMYATLSQALDTPNLSDPVKNRIYDLVIYTRYLELLYKLVSVGRDEKQALFQDILTLVYRAKDTHMFHTKALWASFHFVDSTLKHPNDFLWSSPEHPWKSTESITEIELLGWLQVDESIK